MQTLTDIIAEKIKQSGGKISFSDYMTMALYYPRLGYYTKNARQFGKNGDFITAPEISDLFGKCILNAVKSVLGQFKHPNILEFGAGTGKLAKVLLEHMPDNIPLQKYFILEISPALRQLQKKTLEKYLDKIIWLKNLKDLDNTEFDGLILANEIIDAFPASRFCWQNHQAHEYYVINNFNKNNPDKFEWLLNKTDKNTYKNLDFLKNLNLPENYISEFHPGLEAWIKKLNKILHQGMILFIDYGFPEREFYHPQRSQGTLMCHYQHTANTDPFYLPGLQDITVHVNFTAAARAAVNANFEVSGYTSQAFFLLENNITDFIRTDQDKQTVKLLTLAHEMGELFKVMALTKKTQVNHHLAGFSFNDRRHCL